MCFPISVRVARNLPDAAGQASFFSMDGIGVTAVVGYLVMLVPSFFISLGLIGKVFGAKDERAIRPNGSSSYPTSSPATAKPKPPRSLTMPIPLSPPKSSPNYMPNYNKNTTHQHTSPCIDMWCILRVQPDPSTRWPCCMLGSSRPQRTSPIMP